MIKKEHIEGLKISSGISLSTAANSGALSCSKEMSKELIGVSCEGIGFPYYDINGLTIGHRIKLNKPLPDGGKYLQAKNAELNLYFTKNSTSDVFESRKTLYITEGEKKALALQQVVSEGVCTSIPGCWGWSKDKEIASVFKQIPLSSRSVVLVPDSDFLSKKDVWEGYYSFIKALFERGANVSLINISLPGQDKVGVDDFLLAKKDISQKIKEPLWVFEHINPNHLPSNMSPDEVISTIRKSILLDGMALANLLKILNKLSGTSKPAIDAEHRKQKNIFLKNKPKSLAEKLEIRFDNTRSDQRELYSMLGKRINGVGGFYEEVPTGNLVSKGKSQLNYYLDGADFSQALSNIIPFSPGRYNRDGIFKSSGYKLLDTPEANGFLKCQSEYTKLPKIRQYSRTPLLVQEADNTFSLISKQGYDLDHQVYYDGPKLKASPSTKKIEKAFDYPFATDADRTTAIFAAIGAIFFRPPGLHPMLLSIGNQVNLGKSNYLKSIAYLATGRVPGSADYKPSNEEFAKEILAHLDEEFILFDNIKSPIVSSATLERLITDEVCELRVLGTAKKKSRSNTIQFMCSINGGRFSEDILTRSIPIFLDSKKRNSHKDLIPFIKSNRDSILSEMVGMIQRWISAGSPLIEVKNFNKFPFYGSILAGIAKVNGFKGFLDRAGDALSKLDTIQSSFLEASFEELDNQAKDKTEPRSIKEICSWLTEIYGHEILKDYQSIQSKYNTVAQKLRTMDAQTFPFQAYDRKVSLQILSTDPITKRGGRKKYYVELATAPLPEKTGGRGKDSDNIGERCSSATGHLTLRVRGKKNLNNFSSGALGIGEGGTSVDSNSDNNVLGGATMVKTQVSPVADETWYDEQAGEYTYSFQDKVYPSKWWNGEKLNGDSFSFDIETDSEKHTEIILASAFDGQTLFRLKAEDMKLFYEANKDKNWICHNSSFDIFNLALFLGDKQIAIDLVSKNKVKDSLALSRLFRLATIGTPKGGNKLGEVTERLLGVTLPKDVLYEGKKASLSYAQFQGRVEEAPALFLHYNAFDTIATWFIWRELNQLAEKTAIEHKVDPTKLLSHDNLVRTMLATTLTSHHGFKVNEQRVQELNEDLTAKIEDSLKILQSFGYDPIKLRETRPKKGELTITQIYDNIMSGIEAQGFKTTKKYHKGRKKDVYSSKAEDIEHIDHPFVKAYLAFAKDSKSRETYVKHYLGVDRIHTSFDPCLATGRTSSMKPNLQNLPRTGGVREIFEAGEGKKLVIIDYSSAELFAGCQYAITNYGFSKMAELLKNKIDVHRYISSKFLGIPEEQITKEQRQYGKIVNFGRIGASGVVVLQKKMLTDYGISLSNEEMKKLIAIWESEFPEFKQHFKAANKENQRALGVNSNEAYHIKKAAQGEPLQKDELKDAWDHILRLKGTYPDKLKKFEQEIDNKTPSKELAFALDTLRVATISSGRISAHRKYTEWCNHAIQASQADVTNYAWWLLHQNGLKVVNCIHDEFIIECDEVEAKQTYEKVEEILKQASKRFYPDLYEYMGSEGAITDKWEKV